MLKKLLLIFMSILFLILSSNIGYAHSERVHQYVAREAYNLLKLYLGKDVLPLYNNLGYQETGNFLSWYDRGNEFENGKIVAGAFREDVEDIVYGYPDFWNISGFQEGLREAYASCTHFWDADAGDEAVTNLDYVPNMGLPNAYQKIMRYYSGLTVGHACHFLVTTVKGDVGYLHNIQETAPVNMTYYDLIDLYKTGRVFVALGVIKKLNGDEITYAGDVFLSEDLKNKIVFEILGRMSHLVADMSVPAHVHNNAHVKLLGTQDAYEQSLMDVSWDDEHIERNTTVTYWNGASVWNQYHNIMFPYSQYDTNPLHYLMYTTNQIADHFASRSVNGDNDYNSNYFEVTNYMPFGVGPTTITEYENTYTPNLTTIRDATFPHAIRAVAGLFYWFAKETGLLSPVTVQNNFAGGTVILNGQSLQSGTTTLKVVGEDITLTAVDQSFGNYDRVFNTSGNNLSSWDIRDVAKGQLLAQSYSKAMNYNIPTNDKGLTATAQMSKAFKVSRIDNTEFDGNVSAGVVTSIVEQNSGTVPAPYQQTINGKVYTYGGWTDGGDGTVTPTDNMTTSVLYKVLNKSNCSNAFANNSQKKLVHIYGGWSEKIYESMNKIWMESSTDNGKTWTLTPKNPISGTAVAHSPSIDIPDGPYPYEYIVYYTSDASGSKVMLTINFENLFRSTIDVSGNLPLSNYDFQPVIAIKQNASNSKIIVVWRQPYIDYFDPAGFYYRVGTINPDHTVSWDDYTRVMAYTENCSNPAIVASKTLTDPNQFHLAYQEDMGYGDSRVSYLRLDLNSDNTISYSNGYEVSQGSGYYVNTNPSITLFGGLPKVSWLGYDRVMTYMQDALFRSKDGSFSWGSIYTYGTSGNNAVSVSLDKVGTSGYIMGYGDDCGDVRYVKSTNLSTVRYADNSGSYVQVKGGPDFNSSFITAFHNESLPYYFTSSSTVSVLGKTNTETISGRGITLTKDGLGYSFSLKDVRLDGSQVDFTEKSDSAIAQNNSIETKAFSVGDNSELTYSYSYFTSDSVKVLKSLKDGEVIKYSLDLVDATSSEVLKNLASVSYSNKDVNKKRPEYYKLLLKGIGNRTVKLRISSDETLTDASGLVSTIAKTYSTGSNLKKNSFIEVNYSDVKPVTEYGLSQNYPNPFNPSTVINYQIPKASKVTLKVYDMLGKEVATLVNGFKEMGSYSVEFNASELPSGTYIYEIRANNFVKSGKMLLLK